MSDKPNVDHATAKFMADQWTSAIEAREAMVAEVAQLKAERNRLRNLCLRFKALCDADGLFDSLDLECIALYRDVLAALAAKEPRDE